MTQEQENSSYESDLYSYQTYERQFEMGISLIQNQKTYTNYENETVSYKEKNNYLCKECKTFHLIKIIYEEKKFKEEKKIFETKKDNEGNSIFDEKIVNKEKIVIKEKFIIECNKKGKISLDKFLSSQYRKFW